MKRRLATLWLTHNAAALGLAAAFLVGGVFLALVGQNGIASLEPREHAGFSLATALGNSGIRRQRAPGLSHAARFRLDDGGIVLENLSGETELHNGQRACLALFRGRLTGRRLAEVAAAARCAKPAPLEET